MKRFLGYLVLLLSGLWAFQTNPMVHQQAVKLTRTAQAWVAQVSNPAHLNKRPPNQTAPQATIDEGDQPGGHWSHRQATIYINTNEPTLKAATVEAIKQWNRTGAFTFKLTTNPDQAKVTVAAINDPNSRAAGLAKMSVNPATGTFTTGQVELNRAYLLNPVYNYSQQRIVNTVEHELGHVIGLGHTNQVSVMQPAGSYYPIQPRDVKNVDQLYHQ